MFAGVVCVCGCCCFNEQCCYEYLCGYLLKNISVELMYSNKVVKKHPVGGVVLISVRGRADGSPLFILA